MKPETVTVELTEQDINHLLRVFDIALQANSAVAAAEHTVAKIMRAGLEYMQAAKFADTIIEEVRS